LDWISEKEEKVDFKRKSAGVVRSVDWRRRAEGQRYL
jgi:hypothetical protein